jgi:hypothetical protein
MCFILIYHKMSLFCFFLLFVSSFGWFCYTIELLVFFFFLYDFDKSCMGLLCIFMYQKGHSYTLYRLICQGYFGFLMHSLNMLDLFFMSTVCYDL